MALPNGMYLLERNCSLFVMGRQASFVVLSLRFQSFELLLTLSLGELKYGNPKSHLWKRVEAVSATVQPGKGAFHCRASLCQSYQKLSPIPTHSQIHKI